MNLKHILSGWRLTAAISTVALVTVVCALVLAILVIVDPTRWTNLLALVSTAFVLAALFDRIPFKPYCIVQTVLMVTMATANAWNGRYWLAVFGYIAALIFLGMFIYRTWRDSERERRRSKSNLQRG